MPGGGGRTRGYASGGDLPPPSRLIGSGGGGLSIGLKDAPGGDGLIPGICGGALSGGGTPGMRGRMPYAGRGGYG